MKYVLDVYVEMDENSLKYYVTDFEESMLKDTAIYPALRKPQIDLKENIMWSR